MGPARSVRSVLAEFGASGLSFDAGSAHPVPDLSGLRDQLEAVRRGSRTAFAIATGMLVVLFVLCCCLILTYVGRPSVISGVLGASGLSVMGIVSQMIRLWKEKVASDILIALAMNLPDSELRTIIKVLKPRL